jgi:hypothetical protein
MPERKTSSDPLAQSSHDRFVLFLDVQVTLSECTNHPKLRRLACVLSPQNTGRGGGSSHDPRICEALPANYNRCVDNSRISGNYRNRNRNCLAITRLDLTASELVFAIALALAAWAIATLTRAGSNVPTSMPTTTIVDAGPYRLKFVATKTADQLDLQALTRHSPPLRN